MHLSARDGKLKRNLVCQRSECHVDVTLGGKITQPPRTQEVYRCCRHRDFVVNLRMANTNVADPLRNSRIAFQFDPVRELDLMNESVCVRERKIRTTLRNLHPMKRPQ